MKLTPITTTPDLYPDEIRRIIEGARVFDSSSSPEAKVLFIDRDDGYFLKIGKSRALENEARLGEYFHKNGLAPEILFYASEESDFMLSRKARGLDLTNKIYLNEPYRLAVKMGEVLRSLHELDFSGCPEKDRMKSYFELMEKNAEKDAFDLSFGSFQTKREAYEAALRAKEILKSDTLIHGDFCLPNIIFDGWNFSSFIDLGNAGVGDRHVDIFWGAWTLNFNLKTDKYRDIFFSAYGKDRIESDAIAAVSAVEIFG